MTSPLMRSSAGLGKGRRSASPISTHDKKNGPHKDGPLHTLTFMSTPGAKRLIQTFESLTAECRIVSPACQAEKCLVGLPATRIQFAAFKLTCRCGKMTRALITGNRMMGGGKSGATKVWPCDAAGYCPSLRILRLHRLYRAERGAAFAERRRLHARPDPQDGGQLGYHPDAYARSLRRRRSQTIAVLAYDLSDPFCIPIVHGIQAGLQPADYLPLLVDAQTQRKLFDNYLKMILERRAEGVIVIASWIFEETNLLADIEKNQVPIVIVGRDLTGRRVSSLLVDNEAGGALAMRHLIELGHRQIAIVRGPEELFDSEPRWAGVQRCRNEAGIQIDPPAGVSTAQLDGPNFRL